MYDASAPRLPASTGPGDYRTIFNDRGAAYHQAMVEHPDARDEEFREIVRLAHPRPGQVLCDAPAGGGYLQRYLLPTGCEWIAVETSETFHRLCERHAGRRSLLSRLDALDLPDASVDRVVSLAGLHHLTERAAFFREAFRILKPGGAFCVADVAAGSGVARFLNEFVDRCNSSGHTGDFLDADAPSEFEAAGFSVEAHYCLDYAWTFAAVDDMLRFVTLLFGLDRAQPDEVREGIAGYLGYATVPGGCRMNWGLRFLRSVR